MIGFNKTAQSFLTVLIIVFSLLLIVLQVVRLDRSKKESNEGGKIFRQRDFNLWICELLLVICLAIVVAVNFVLYWGYIPADSPGCLPQLSDFGVIASGVDPVSFITLPATYYTATTYDEAVSRFLTSPNGLSTGYFAWDGLSVTILNAKAHHLKTGAPPGTSWVFQNLSITTTKPVKV